MVDSEDELVTTVQLCDWIKIGKSTVSRWKTKGMPYVITVKGVRYKKSDVMGWIERNASIAVYYPETITEKELCKCLQVTAVTAWRWRKEGMPYLGGKKTIRYNKKQVIS